MTRVPIIGSDIVVAEKVGFIGGGQMAFALASGAVTEGVLSSEDLLFAEPNPGQRQKLQQRFTSAQIAESADQVLPNCEKVILAIKPHILRAIASEIAAGLKESHLVVSIAAGISLTELQAKLGTKRVVRVMPNTPALVGTGASAFAADTHVSESDTTWVEKLLNSVGLCVRVPDELMHAVTAVSGSGPAYMYMIIEALSDGGVAMGLPRAMATQLATQTMLGAATMVSETDSHPGALKDQVTSPGGTTIAAIRALESRKVRSAMMEAVAAAEHRSRELE